MSNAKRTPGPWAIELWGEEFPSSATVYSEALGRGVGSIAYITPSGMRENTAIADARLMAAAPDLLDAGKRFLAATDAYDEDDRAAMDEWRAARIALRVAVAKAEAAE